MKDEFNLSEHREMILQNLDKKSTWNDGTRRYLVLCVLETVKSQDKEFLRRLKEIIAPKIFDNADLNRWQMHIINEIDKLAGESLFDSNSPQTKPDRVKSDNGRELPYRNRTVRRDKTADTFVLA